MKGHIRERSPGRWAIVIDVRDPQSGERKRRWHSFAGTKRQAQIECARLVTEAQGGAPVDPARITIAAFLERWLGYIETRVSPRTYENYVAIVRVNLIPRLGTVALAKLQPAAIVSAYAEALKNGRRDGTGGLSPSSVQLMHGVLASALKQAVKWRLLTRSPCDVVSSPRVERTQAAVLDFDTAAAYIEAARGRAIFMPIVLGVLCGLRRGEMAALRWGNVDLDHGRMSIVASTEQTNRGTRRKPPKSGRSRVVALPSLVIEELRRHRVAQAEQLLRLGVRQSDETHVCLQPNYEPWPPRNLSGAFIKFVVARGLPRVRLHDLRHSHATHLLQANVHPKVVQERLGHANIAITMDLYTHVMPGMQDDAASRVDIALRAALKRRRD